jgi:hypothetical protein
MLSIGKMGAGQHAYYLGKVAEGAEDYYSGKGEAEGYWLGDAAEDLGLQGKVEADQLIAMLTGVDPATGEPLGLQHAFKAKLLTVASEQEELVAAGGELRDARGRAVVPLGPSSIKKILDTFAAVLDEAIEDDYRDDNPGRSKRMQIAVPKPERTFLEMDELAALLDAASSQT